jgi:MFS transporter, DHA1 family, multidrug resistance protein
MSFVYILGTLLCRRLLPRFGVRRSVAIAAVLTLTGGTLVGVLPLLGLTSVWAIMVPFWLLMVAHGVHQPCSQSGAVGPFPHAAGAASALNGFLMMVAAFGVGGWLGARMDGTTAPLTNGVWFWSVCIAVSAWTAVQRYGEPRHA